MQNGNAQLDQLTTVFQRNAFSNLVSKQLFCKPREALIWIDIDNLKYINRNISMDAGQFCFGEAG